MAVPNPVNEFARLQKQVERGLPPVLVVTGPSDFFRAKAMERVMAAVPADVELRVVDAVDVRAAGDDGGGDDADGGVGDTDSNCQELQDLRGGGLFARATVVVVRRGPNWWKLHAPTLAATMAKIAPGSALVLEASKLDKRKKAAAGLVKSLQQDQALFEFRELYDLPYDRSRSPLEGELCHWVVAVSRKLGVTLQPESAWLVISQVGKVPNELVAELERLRDQLGVDAERPPLPPAQLAGKLTCSFESTPFEFAEAVLAGDRRDAERCLAAMFARGVRQKDGKAMEAGGVLPFTTSWLHQQLSTLHEGRVLLDGGVPLRDLPARVGVHQFADRFLDNVRRHDLGRLQHGLIALHACQRSSRLTGEDAEALLERFLAQWFGRASVATAEEFEL